MRPLYLILGTLCLILMPVTISWALYQPNIDLIIRLCTLMLGLVFINYAFALIFPPKNLARPKWVLPICLTGWVITGLLWFSQFTIFSMAPNYWPIFFSPSIFFGTYVLAFWPKMDQLETSELPQKRYRTYAILGWLVILLVMSNSINTNPVQPSGVFLTALILVTGYLSLFNAYNSAPMYHETWYLMGENNKGRVSSFITVMIISNLFNLLLMATPFVNSQRPSTPLYWIAGLELLAASLMLSCAFTGLPHKKSDSR